MRRLILLALLLAAPAQAQITIEQLQQGQALSAGQMNRIIGQAATAGVFGSATSPSAYTFSTGAQFRLTASNTPENSDALAAALFAGGFPRYDVIQGVGVLPAGSNIVQLNSVAGYVRSDAVASASARPAAVALFGVGTGTVDGAKVWGLATALGDPGSGDGTGRWLINEMDFNPSKANTKIQGLLLSGAGTVQPADADGIVISGISPSVGGKWQSGLRTLDNAAFKALTIGLSTPFGLNNTTSQILAFTGTDTGGTARQTWLYSQAQTLHLTGDSGTGSLQLDTGNLVMGAQGAAAPNVSSFPIVFNGYNSSGVATFPGLRAARGYEIETIGPSTSITIGAGGSLVLGTGANRAYMTADTSANMTVTSATARFSGKLNMGTCPTSSAGLSSGDIWCNSNVLTRVP